jgi:hypothetical protein
MLNTISILVKKMGTDPAQARRSSCVRQVQQIGHVERALIDFRSIATSLCSIEKTIPSSRPVRWQSTARSGSQGCRRAVGGIGGAGAQRP